ncbi:MFS transporter [Candidatus Peregrinibacteria bacterium]|nr:MFS transporter [Candidatus Peregrinibacteria bacterium]MBT7736307.1 MFS transporter [Candidatus Peregrinibacteria bacterium]
MANVGIVIATFSLSLLIFEIPSGAIADLFGRKTTIILGYILWIIALVVLYFADSMFGLISFSVLDGMASSLFSGADSALIYDTLKEEGKERHYKKAIGLYHSMWPLGAAAGAVIGGYIAAIDLKLAVLLSIPTAFMAFLFVLPIKEPKFHKEEHKNVLRQMKKSIKIAISSRQILILIGAGFILWGLGEASHWIDSIYYTFKGIEIKHFGYITGAAFGLSSLGHFLSHKFAKKVGDKNAILLTVGIWIVLFFSSTLMAGWPAVILFVIPALLFGLRAPVEEHIANAEVSSSQRATVLSIVNFSRQSSMAIFTPLVGYFADLYDLDVAFRASSIIMIVAFVIFFGLKSPKKV